MSGKRPQQPRRPQTRINDAIRAPKVLLIDEDGTQLGIKPTNEAREYAYGKDLDLVEVAAQASPPVCRVMNYSKHRYEEQRKERETRRKSHRHELKQIRVGIKIAVADYQTKLKHVRTFLDAGHEVQVQVRFRGREAAHPQLGVDLLKRFVADAKDLGQAKGEPSRDGRTMQVMIAPLAKKVQRVDEPPAGDAPAVSADTVTADTAVDTAVDSAAE